MNTDASTFKSAFSLEIAAQVIRPHIKFLPFKRLSHYLSQHDDKEKIGGVEYCCRLWDINTRIPASFEKNWKAYGVRIRSDTIIPRSSAKPTRIEHERLIIMCPTDDAVVWAFQHSKFTREKGSDSYFTGTSEISHIDDESLNGITQCNQDLPEKFWCAFQEWGRQSIKDREKAIASLQPLTKLK